ncbi:MAG: hypothetical protein N3C13_02440 [Aquificaceae bacterium]|nr:hypothetical protein [Aquificaceae bacterium]
MLNLLITALVGFLLGLGFVELTYRLAGSSLYLLSLPFKLTLWATSLAYCQIEFGLYGLFSCLLGFLTGFFLLLTLRAFVGDGRAQNS